MDTNRIFTAISHSALYAKFRPVPPSQMLTNILGYMKVKNQPPYKQAVDVGCGSGQSTSLLAPHFEHVLGIDVSESQINEANKKETNANVQYKVGSCDSIPLPDASAELVTAAQAAHWFDLPSFYKEVDRVLKPKGILALYTYSLPFLYEQEKGKELKDHISHIYNVDTAGYWHEKRKIVDEMYSGIELPYKEQSRQSFTTDVITWKLTDYLGYVQSWSGYQELKKQNPQKAVECLQNFQAKVMKTLNVSTAPEDVKLNFRMIYTLLMARKPSV